MITASPSSVAQEYSSVSFIKYSIISIISFQYWYDAKKENKKSLKNFIAGITKIIG